MWLKFANTKIVEAQSLGGLGPPGGAYPTGLNWSDKYGGPRWWPFGGDRNLDDFIRTQIRYHPQYKAIGEAAEIPDEGWETITQLPEIFYGKDPDKVTITAIQDGENKEGASLVMLDNEAQELRVEALPFEKDDIVKELDNWQFKIVPNEDNGYSIMGKRIDQSGDKKGIFELNGDHAVPGWKFWMKQTPSPTPGDKAHGDLSEFTWNNWRENGGQPGM